MTTALAILATAILATLLVRQHRKTRAAEHSEAIWRDQGNRMRDTLIEATAERDEARCTTAAAKIELATTRRRLKRIAAESLTHAVAAERAQNERDDALARCLPVAPVRTADPSIAAVPWPSRKVVPVEPDGVLALGTVTPIKRVGER